MKKIIILTVFMISIFVNQSNAGPFGKYGKVKERSDGSTCCRWAFFDGTCLRVPFWNC